MKKPNTRTLAMLAMFTAVSIILARLLGFYVTDSIRVSFEYFTIILAGTFFGPVAGAVVGGLSDFIGANVLSGLGFFPPLIVGPIAAGFIAGLLAKYVFSGNMGKWWKVMTVTLAAEILCNLLWGTYALSMLYGAPYLTLLVARSPVKLIVMVLDAQLVFVMYKSLRPLLKGKAKGE